MRAVLEIKDVNDADRTQLINYVRAYPVLWAQHQGKGGAKTAEAWTFIAGAMSTPERIFEIALIKKMWKNLRDQYVKHIKAGSGTSSKWQFFNTLAFLGTEFATRVKKVKTEDDGTEQPAKKKAKGKKKGKEEPQAEVPQFSQQFPPMPHMQNQFQNSCMSNMPQFQMHPNMQQFYPQVPMPQFSPAQNQSLPNSDIYAKWGISPAKSDSDFSEGFLTPKRGLKTEKGVHPVFQLGHNFGAVNSSASKTSPNELLTAMASNSDNASCKLTYDDVKPVFESIRAEIATFVKRLNELESKFQA